MCRKDDCGKCSSCKSNRTTTTIQRQVCWHKMCLNIPTHQKVQPLPGLLNVDCKFYFTDESSYANLDHSANGLRIIAGGKEYDCIRPAMLACGIEGESLNNTITQFFDKQLGLKLRRLLPRHPLTNGGYFLEWSDVNGGRKVIRGTITHAWESLEGQGRSFTVRYDDGLRDAAQYTPGCGCRIPAFDENVQEQMAWGGYVAFLRKAQPFAGRLEVFTVKPQIPFHWQWIVPEVRLELAEVSATLAALDCNIPRLVMFVDGSKLVFQANKSSIEGAGLGLWVTCKTERGLQLAPGCFLDLGKYAPLRNEDRKSDNLCLLKNFLYAWNGEGWSFDTAPHEQDMQFDITDDGTGELHRLAKFNPLVYANETDGKKEVPSLRAFYDPEGCVHYLMGHQERCQGPLQLPFNEPVELKVTSCSEAKDLPAFSSCAL